MILPSRWTGSGCSADPALIDQAFRKAWLPYFCCSVRGVADLEDFSAEVEEVWLPALDPVQLSPLTGGMLHEVVDKTGLQQGSWMAGVGVASSMVSHGLASILRLVEADRVWPDGFYRHDPEGGW